MRLHGAPLHRLDLVDHPSLACACIHTPNPAACCARVAWRRQGLHACRVLGWRHMRLVLVGHCQWARRPDVGRVCCHTAACARGCVTQRECVGARTTLPDGVRAWRGVPPAPPCQCRWHGVRQVNTDIWITPCTRTQSLPCGLGARATARVTHCAAAGTALALARPLPTAHCHCPLPTTAALPLHHCPLPVSGPMSLRRATGSDTTALGSAQRRRSR